MKIYTKTGDKGTTSLVSGRRVNKAELILEAYGTIDELNAFVGLLINQISSEIKPELLWVQNVLFNIGSILAKDGANYPDYPSISTQHITQVELMIDRLNENLAELRQFILPSGNEGVSRAHLCRTICRRAERRVVALEIESEEMTLIVQYLNRLSDYFFTLARWIANDNIIEEIYWDKNV